MLPRHALPIRLDEARIVAPYRLHATRRQRIIERNHALFTRRADFTRRLVSYGQCKAHRRYAWRAELLRQRFNTAWNRDHRPAGFGLPVVIDDRLFQRSL